MKNTYKISILMIVLLLLCTSCSSENTFDSTQEFVTEDYNYSDGMYTEGTFDEAIDTEAPSAAVDANDSKPGVETNRKIIKTTELSVETKEFDALIDKLTEEIEAIGGYIESADITGRPTKSTKTRTAELTIRIPADQDSSFLHFVSEHSIITRQYVQTKDITLAYVDTESRLSVLKAEKESLEALLEKATSVEDIIALTDRLTNVIQEMESYESQLRTYDNLVDYCTVSVFIDEVEFTTDVQPTTVWQKIGSNLKKNFANVWNGIKGLFVFAISILPYVLPFAIIGGIILIIIRLRIKRRHQKAEDSPAPPTEPKE